MWFDQGEIRFYYKRWIGFVSVGCFGLEGIGPSIGFGSRFGL